MGSCDSCTIPAYGMYVPYSPALETRNGLPIQMYSHKQMHSRFDFLAVPTLSQKRGSAVLLRMEKSYESLAPMKVNLAEKERETGCNQRRSIGLSLSFDSPLSSSLESSGARGESTRANNFGAKTRCVPSRCICRSGGKNSRVQASVFTQHM